MAAVTAVWLVSVVMASSHATQVLGVVSMEIATSNAYDRRESNGQERVNMVRDSPLVTTVEGDGATAGHRKVASMESQAAPRQLPAKTVVFEAGIGGFPCVRVPSLLAIPGGPLLAFAECRLFTGDGCEPVKVSTAHGNHARPRAEGSAGVDPSSTLDSGKSSDARVGPGLDGTEGDLRDRVVCMRASTDKGVTWGPLQRNISRGRAMCVARDSSPIIHITEARSTHHLHRFVQTLFLDFYAGTWYAH